MKRSLCNAVFLTLLLLPLVISARHIGRQHSRHGQEHGNPVKHADIVHGGTRVKAGKQKGVNTVQIAGSRLPDCSHACGSCSPCRLVMVSFICASLAEAESCPMAYKCMCKNKSYPVP